MDKNGIVAVFLLFFIVADVSDASLLSAFRRFVAVASMGSFGTSHISPSPGPDPLLIGTKTTSNGTSSKERKVPNDLNKSKTDSQSEVGQNCTGMTRRCKDQDKLVACILYSETVSSLFQISLTAGNGNEVILKAGRGECILHTDLPVSQGNTFLSLPSYDKLTTPINGVSACCFFRKRKQQNGIPYQELEMGLPESSVVYDVETAEGWDEGWDDECGGENAVKSPSGHHSGSISANGLISRSLKKGEGENWDD
uniref:Uncharacterized protein n=1 Tax=Manihot esculenta TaxID=3983 RepID=A0A2C9VJG4_MANES